MPRPPRPPKFTQEVRETILECLMVGSNRQTAAYIAGANPSQITRWMQRGEKTPEGQFGEFRRDVLAAEAHPKERALGIIYKAMPDRPDLAWKFIERREKGYEPPAPRIPAMPSGRISIQLMPPGHQTEPTSIVKVLNESNGEPDSA
jgi:hypothetical protein